MQHVTSWERIAKKEGKRSQRTNELRVSSRKSLSGRIITSQILGGVEIKARREGRKVNDE